MDMTAVFVGARTGFVSGSVKELSQDLITLHPSVMAAVPRVYDKIYDGIQQQLKKKSCFERTVFNIAYDCFSICPFNSVISIA